MSALTILPSARGRARAFAFLLTAAALLLAWAPAGASASGCTDSWTNAAGGSWFNAANWSTKAVPGPTDEACITLAGTYSVEMAQKSNVSLKALTVGGASGTQTLLLASTNGTNAVLTTSGGITNAAHGSITLTNAETAGNNVTIVGPVANAGTITAEPAHGGQRNLQGNFVNTGTLAVNTNVAFNETKAQLTNEGAINLATGTQLIATAESSVTNGTGGKVAATGSGDVQLEPGTSFTEGAGITSGSKPVIVRDAALHYTGTGASSIATHGTSSTISGNVASGQSISIESINAEHSYLTAAASFTSAGTITLTSTEASANQAALIVSAGTLSNSGSINVEAGVGGPRFLEGNLTNTGTIAINATTKYDAKAVALTNQGALNLATGTQLLVTNESSVTNGTGGSIAATGSGNVQLEPGTSFTEGAGTTSGSKPVIVRDAALHYTGTGASSIATHGTGSTISGNVASGQSISIESINAENSYLTAAASFTSAGTITLTSTEASANQAALIVSAGTLSNSGSINVEAGVGGPRYIEGNLTNTGTIAINATTKYNASSAVLTNEGALKLTTATQLLVTNAGSVINGTGGSIVAGEGAAVVDESGTSFTEGAGTTSGTKPVIVRDGSLKYTGSGASVIAVHGTGSTLSGNLAAGQSLSIESTNSENAQETAATGFTNAGTIVLTSTETNANFAALTMTTGTLTNSGSIKVETGVGGARYLEGSLTNTGTLAVSQTTKYDTAKATLSNQGAINIATGVALAVTGASTVSNESGGMIAATGTGALTQTEGTFNQGLGKTTTSKTSEPVILDRVALHYLDKGVSKIAQRGTSTLSGTISPKVTLSIQSTCSEHAVDTAAGSFLNSGTINLTNVETCPNNVTLALSGGTLENKGTINVLFPHGGVRTIEGGLTNEKTLSIANEASQALKVTGSYSQGAKATLKLTIAGTSNFSRLAAGGSVALAGKLSLKQLKFTGKAGESFGVITGASRSGEFASVTGNAIKGGTLHYVPHYGPAAVSLVVE